MTKQLLTVLKMTRSSKLRKEKKCNLQLGNAKFTNKYYFAISL